MAFTGRQPPMGRPCCARGLLPTTPQSPDSGERYVPATGQTLSEPFLSIWQRSGGMITLGMPRTAPFIERSIDSGRDELVQYFERGRIEVPLAGEAAPTLGRAAAALVAEQGPAPPKARAPIANTSHKPVTTCVAICCRHRQNTAAWQLSATRSARPAPLSNGSSGAGSNSATGGCSSA
ncbi:hypothetical protein [Chloroflexus sp.]|uniref:hypothetical protein n=1 Tax=Chloroflexus sp. TaxID=1904827 RepID=UPI00298EDC35|nr:hypothetical protein [Chloroflexus sp.]MDW8403239.1 hypothetical protein [Chloroflexus sp.]